MANKEGYSFKQKKTESGGSGVKAGKYSALVIGVCIFDRIAQKDTKYTTKGDVTNQFTPIILANVINDKGEEELRASSFYGLPTKFSQGKSNNSKGFDLLKNLGDEDGPLTNSSTEELIKELSDDEGNFEYGYFFGKECTAVYEAKSKDDPVYLTELQPAGRSYVKPNAEGFELPEFILAYEDGDGNVTRKNVLAGFIDEIMAVEKNKELVDQLEVTHEA